MRLQGKVKTYADQPGSLRSFEGKGAHFNCPLPGLHTLGLPREFWKQMDTLVKTLDNLEEA